MPKPDHLEGLSLVSNLNNPEEELHRYVYSIWPHDRTNYEKTVMGYSVKDGRYNYVEWIKLSTGEVLEKELYDHQTDPNETINVFGEDAYGEVIKKLAEKVQERKEATYHHHAQRIN